MQYQNGKVKKRFEIDAKQRTVSLVDGLVWSYRYRFARILGNHFLGENIGFFFSMFRGVYLNTRRIKEILESYTSPGLFLFQLFTEMNFSV